MKKIDKLLNNIDEDKYLDNEKPLSENEKKRFLIWLWIKLKIHQIKAKTKVK